MSEWKAGDLALCVNDYRAVAETPLRTGGVYTVEAVICGGQGLTLVGVVMPPPYAGARVICFRRLDPHKADEDDREVIALLTYAPTFDREVVDIKETVK